MDSSNLQTTLNSIEAFTADRELAIERGKMLERLKLNPDFQSLFLEVYIETEARKLFNILTDPTGASPYTDEQIHLMLAAISYFKGFVGTPDFRGTIEVDAELAVSEIEREQDYRKELTESNGE